MAILGAVGPQPPNTRSAPHPLLQGGGLVQ